MKIKSPQKIARKVDFSEPRLYDAPSLHTVEKMQQEFGKSFRRGSSFNFQEKWPQASAPAQRQQQQLKPTSDARSLLSLCICVVALLSATVEKVLQIHCLISGRFRKRVVLANVPSFRFSFRGNIRMYPHSSFRSGGT